MAKILQQIQKLALVTLLQMNWIEPFQPSLQIWNSSSSI